MKKIYTIKETDKNMLKYIEQLTIDMLKPTLNINKSCLKKYDINIDVLNDIKKQLLT
jgi:hypothetical protein